MERRHFLKLTLGVAAGTAALAAGASAAPLAPQPLARDERLPLANEGVQPAIVTEDEVNRLEPEEVHWGWRRHRRHWRRWRRRYW
jgi:hypothetical protein